MHYLFSSEDGLIREFLLRNHLTQFHAHIQTTRTYKLDILLDILETRNER